MAGTPAAVALSPSPYMERALGLARAVKGRTSPNPAVGAVLVKDERIVGEGATQPYGQPHAEAVALAAAGAAARGATLYVTLEPCAHFGRTPPCADALVAAGVEAAHLATLDPNARVAGRGARRLQEAGVRVSVGDGLAAARALNEDFACWVTTGRPYVTAKFACSLDGKIATRTGESRWITGPEARAEGHRIRDRVDAILVGVNTVLSDDPQLTTRLADDLEVGLEDGTRSPPRAPHHPHRFVLDSTGRTPPAARLLDRSLPGRTSVVTTEASDPAWRAAVAAAGAEVLVLPALEGRVALEPLLDHLGRQGVTSLLVEGGATVHGALFDGGLADFVLAFVAPLVIGGAGAPGAVGGAGAAALARAPRLLEPEVRQLGADTLVAGPLRRVVWPEWTPARG